MRAAEEDAALGEAPVALRHPRRGERLLPTGEPERLHLRIGRQEPPAEEVEEALQRRAVEREGLLQHEVLHAVGGDDVGVVAPRVRRQEVVSEDLDVDLQREEAVPPAGERRLGDRRQARQRARVDAVERHARLAVADLVAELRPHRRPSRCCAAVRVQTTDAVS